jgi:hypothetical protein
LGGGDVGGLMMLVMLVMLVIGLVVFKEMSNGPKSSQISKSRCSRSRFGEAFGFFWQPQLILIVDQTVLLLKVHAPTS